MSEKLSDWFPASTPPTLPGVYEMHGVPVPFHYWDGKQWLQHAGFRPSDCSPDKIAEAGPMAGFITYHLERDWRGLAENPEA